MHGLSREVVVESVVVLGIVMRLVAVVMLLKSVRALGLGQLVPVVPPVVLGVIHVVGVVVIVIIVRIVIVIIVVAAAGVVVE